MFTFLPGLLRPTREGAQGGASSVIREGACGLHEQSKSRAGALLAFLRKPRNISLFSLLYFLDCKILSLSLSLFLSVTDAVLPRETLDPTGAGPR